MVARQLGFASPAGTSAGVRADPAGSPFYCPIGMVALTVPWSWWPPLVQIEPVTLHARPPAAQRDVDVVVVTSTSSGVGPVPATRFALRREPATPSAQDRAPATLSGVARVRATPSVWGVESATPQWGAACWVTRGFIRRRPARSSDRRTRKAPVRGRASAVRTIRELALPLVPQGWLACSGAGVGDVRPTRRRFRLWPSYPSVAPRRPPPLPVASCPARVQAARLRRRHPHRRSRTAYGPTHGLDIQPQLQPRVCGINLGGRRREPCQACVPARAGVTPARASVAARQTVHPRARGVDRVGKILEGQPR